VEVVVKIRGNLESRKMAKQQAAAPAAAAAAQSATVYWRAAGMTYVHYANQCAVLLRQCMKEPFRTQSLSRETVHYKSVSYADGQPQKSVFRGVAAGTSEK